jgi:hypothetical protein
MPTVAAYVAVKDNELLVEAGDPVQSLPAFDAPGADLSYPPVLIFRVRPNTSHGDVRLRLRLNQNVIGDDSFFNSAKRGWTEVIRPGVLREQGNDLSVELLSPDGSAPPAGSAVGVAEGTMIYSVQV